MSLLPTVTEMVARARTDLRVGLPVALTNASETVLMLPAETASDARFNDLKSLGPLQAVVTAWRAETLKIRIYDDDIARIALPPESDASWLNALADPARDLASPMKGPFREIRDGNPELARLAVGLTKSAQLLPAAVLVQVDQRPEGLTVLTAAAAQRELAAASELDPVAAAKLPMEAAQAGRLRVFRPSDGEVEHYAVEIGNPDRSKPVLVRLHSACFTGDVLGSLKCDCGPQLRGALARMGELGEGVLLYLNQEGRGIGLANKMRAYSLQDQGFDTVEANHRLGFEDDERDFRIGASLLREMGFSAVRLMTNNPRKVAMLEAEGLVVADRVPLIIDPNRHNAHYLAVKREKSGHLFG